MKVRIIWTMKTLTFLVVVVLGLGSLNAGQAAESPSRPEAVGGKHYSLDECMRIARWVISQPKNAENLTGVDLGNLWYTLDSCGYLYFSDAKTLFFGSRTSKKTRRWRISEGFSDRLMGSRLGRGENHECHFTVGNLDCRFLRPKLSAHVGPRTEIL